LGVLLLIRCVELDEALPPAVCIGLVTDRFALIPKVLIIGRFGALVLPLSRELLFVPLGSGHAPVEQQHTKHNQC
jgi:hypothetical protein